MRRFHIAVLTTAAAVALSLTAVSPAQATGATPSVPADALWVANPGDVPGPNGWWSAMGNIHLYVPDTDTVADHLEWVPTETSAPVAFTDFVPGGHWTASLNNTMSDRAGYRMADVDANRIFNAPKYFTFWVVAADGTPSLPYSYATPTAVMSDTDPGPRLELAPVWDTAGGARILDVPYPTRGDDMIGGALTDGHANPADLSTDVVFGQSGAPSSPWDVQINNTGAGVMTQALGTPVTLTLWRGSSDKLHYSRWTYDLYLGIPNDTAVSVTGPLAPKAGTAPTYTLSARSGTAPVPGATVALQSRTYTNPTWVTRATRVVGDTGTATVTLGALTQGIAVRAVLTAGPTAVSGSLTSVDHRTLTTSLSRTSIAHAKTVILSGRLTGAAPATLVTVSRCASATSSCTTYRTLRTTVKSTFAVTVVAPAVARRSYYYRVVVAASGGWTPAVISVRRRLLAT